MVFEKSIIIGGRTLSVTLGRVARQAHGAAWVQYGDTVLLATAVISETISDKSSFTPLMVDYREKSYAAGKIPGGFFKREGRPSEKEVLSARLVDRPLRPLFPKELRNEIMVGCFVMSSDQENDADILGINAASIALSISEIPFLGPIGAVRVGKINNEFVVNPIFSLLKDSNMEIVVVGTMDDLIMVEGEAKEISEDEMVKALRFAHNEIKQIITIQQELMKECGVPKRTLEKEDIPADLKNAVHQFAYQRIVDVIHTQDKRIRRQKMCEITEETKTALAEQFPNSNFAIELLLSEFEKNEIRSVLLTKGVRIDGRGVDDIRPITCEISVLPRTHGSAIFTRGQTQALAVTTLGSKIDEQKIEDLVGGEWWKRYMLHYNFPSFCVGEVKIPRGPSRREIGHGNLAERALKSVMPDESDFPYTIRIVSDILESNGSSSMATVCAGSLSLMDAGVPIKRPVAGIAMGLIKENNTTLILTDILGDEDHIGDMDFKITGTRTGITAMQMDIKIGGVSFDIIEKALDKARENRFKILDIMEQTINAPRSQISPYAPKIFNFKIDIENIGAVIGPGGKIIREIQTRYNCTISIEDDGTVFISAHDSIKGEEAKNFILVMLQGPEVGQIYKGKVRKITNFGAFVEILPGKDGLLHISEIENRRINKVEDVLKLGDEIEVQVKRVDPQGKIDLTRKALLKS